MLNIQLWNIKTWVQWGKEESLKNVENTGKCLMLILNVYNLIIFINSELKALLYHASFNHNQNIFWDGSAAKQRKLKCKVRIELN